MTEQYKLQEVPVAETGTHVQLAEIISLRDYIAMSALGGIISEAVTKDEKGTHFADCKEVAALVYVYADAVLAERAKHESKS